MSEYKSRSESSGRRGFLMKVVVGGAAAWTAPAVLSSTAFAQGTPCPDFSLADGGTTCAASAVWRVLLENTSASTIHFLLNGSGCTGFGDVPFDAVPGASSVDIFTSLASTPCDQTVQFNQLSGLGGSVVCSQSISGLVECGPDPGPGVPVPDARTPAEPQVIITHPDGTTNALL